MCVVFWSLTHPEYALCVPFTRARVCLQSGYAPLTMGGGSILCANRDEFLVRPTLPAHFHSFEALSQPASASDGPAVQQDKGTTGSILSGRDMLAGGTWLGINRSTGRIAVM